jgi:ABC-type antimicrobial peptide transport system permease subunit
MNTEFDEVIFNLFIMKFAGMDIIGISNERLLDSLIFKIVKDCFPTGEFTAQELFHKDDRIYYKYVNYISE